MLALVAAVVLIVKPFASRVTVEKLAACERAVPRAAAVPVGMTHRPPPAPELVAGAMQNGTGAPAVSSGAGGFTEALTGLEGDVPVGPSLRPPSPEKTTSASVPFCIASA